MAKAMTKAMARAIVGGLGKPSKMPGLAYGLPAEECKVGSKLREVVGSTCHDCYAMKGCYRFPVVKAAQYRRLESLSDPRWTAAMVTLIVDQAYFRWHDSGDLQSVDHLSQIVDVCRQTPNTKHWMPTKEKAIIAKYVSNGGVIPDNLSIRMSATMVDGKAPKGASTTATVHKDGTPTGHVCPAPTQNGECGECRACWSKDVVNVSYHIH